MDSIPFDRLYAAALTPSAPRYTVSAPVTTTVAVT